MRSLPRFWYHAVSASAFALGASRVLGTWRSPQDHDCTTAPQSRAVHALPPQKFFPGSFGPYLRDLQPSPPAAPPGDRRGTPRARHNTCGPRRSESLLDDMPLICLTTRRCDWKRNRSMWSRACTGRRRTWMLLYIQIWRWRVAGSNVRASIEGMKAQGRELCDEPGSFSGAISANHSAVV